MTLVPTIRWKAIADFLIVAGAFYALLRWARSARALRMVLGVVALHALALFARNLDLVITSWVLDGCAILAILALLLIFQPELRRAFMRVDSALRSWPRPGMMGSQTSRAVSNAAFELSRKKLGALLVITRRDSIGELIEGGTTIGAGLSPVLLEAIFQKHSPLHDGAVIITDGRLARANVVLPLTRRQDLPRSYGTRHRAAVGLAERCDALVTTVSEERGEVTLMESGRIQQINDPEQFVALLDGLMNPTRKSLTGRLRWFFSADIGLKVAALGLAAVIWGMSFLASGTSIRTVSAPIEFDDVPPGLEVAAQSADTLDIQLRGNSWIMDSINPGALVAKFDLAGQHVGWQTQHYQSGSLDLPPGIRVDRVTPPTVRVELVHSGAETMPE